MQRGWVLQAQPLSVHLLGAGEVQSVMALSWEVLALCTLHAFVMGKIRNGLGSESGTSLLPPSNAAALTQDLTHHIILLLYLLCFFINLVVSPL